MTVGGIGGTITLVNLVGYMHSSGTIKEGILSASIGRECDSERE